MIIIIVLKLDSGVDLGQELGKGPKCLKKNQSNLVLTIKKVNEFFTMPSQINSSSIFSLNSD